MTRDEYPYDTTPHYYYGLDLGQQRDHTALAVLEKSWQVFDTDHLIRTGIAGKWIFRVRRLELIALHTPYPEIVHWVRDQMNRLDERYRRTLLVDATGVGTAVMDLFRRAKVPATLIGVTITGGTQPGYSTSHDIKSVSRTELLTALQIAVQEQRFTISRRCSETQKLIEQMANLKATGKTGQDDLAFALALAVWWAIK